MATSSHSTPIIGQFRYRPEIDGLRAISVLAVVLFHSGFGCPGGFVGVDVFFVISGFLITSLIWKDLERETFTFANFWERRARRIVPALVVVTVATLIAGWFILLPTDYQDLGKASASQAIFGANIFYWQTTGYFSGSADEKALLHTWSLAVEEQFYLIVPVLLWGVAKCSFLRGRSMVISILSLGFVLSFGLSIWGINHYPSATFYLLPTRAWELLLGGLIVFLPLSLSSACGRRSRELLSLSGLLLIFYSIFFYEKSTPFPGLAALPPCLGAALLIWSNLRHGSSIPTVVGSLLAIRPLVFIGAISYSWYLWHWPFLAFGKYLVTDALLSFSGPGLFLAGLICAILSWKYVESPFRMRHIGASRRTMFSYAGTGLCLVFGLGFLCVAMTGFPHRFPAQAQQIANAESDMEFIFNLDAEDIRSGQAVQIGKSDSSAPSAVMVWGDSHAMAALPAFDTLLRDYGLSGRAATHSSTAPVAGWFTNTKYGLNEEAVGFNDAVINYVQDQQIPIVILHARWGTYSNSKEADVAEFEKALMETVRRLVSIGAQPYVLLDVPTHPFHVPRTLSRALMSGRGLPTHNRPPTPTDQFDSIRPEVIEEIWAAGGRIIDPKPPFLDSSGKHYMCHTGELVLYRDEHHLTTRGAISFLTPVLAAALGDELALLRDADRRKFSD